MKTSSDRQAESPPVDPRQPISGGIGADGTIRISQAVDEFLAATEVGNVDRAALLAKYQDVADELAGCLDTLDFVNNVAPPLSEPLVDASGNNSPTISPLATLGDFRIVREIGRGGMGVVYEAEQLSLERRVALKVLPFAAMLDRKQLKRFKNEARAAATLDHPNIVAVFSVGEERGVHYYAMQLVEGQSLAEVIGQLRETNGVTLDEPVGQAARTITFAKQRRQACVVPACTEKAAPVSPADDTQRDLQAAVSTVPAFDTQEYHRNIARLGAAAARALDHAHQFGILHRDIKPGNLLVDMDGELQVTDFGLARIEADAGMTMTGDLLGTLAYMSPEQALAKRVVVDHRSDIYSLGVTLYELLTLHPAYVGKDRQELLKKIAFDEPRRPRQLNSRIPHDLETIVCKAIEKSPDDRYATAQELADDLQRFLSDQPIQASPPSLRQRTAKWSRRNQGLVAGAAVVMALLFVAAAIATAIVWQEQERTQAALDNAKQQQELAVQQKLLSEQSAAESEALVEFFVNDLLGAADVSRSRGDLVTVAEVLETAEEKLAAGFDGPPLLEAKIRYALAKVNHSLSKYAHAEYHLRKALDIHLREHEFNEDTFQTKRDLTFALSKQDKTEEAIRMKRVLHQEMARAFGPYDEETLGVLVDTAQLLGVVGKHNEAQSMLRDLARDAQGAAEPVRTHLLAAERWCQGDLAERQENFEEAKRYLKESIERGKDVHSEAERLRISAQLARCHCKLKEFAEARDLQEGVLAKQMELLGPTHNTTLTAMCELAHTLFKLTKLTEGDDLERVRDLLRMAAATAYEHEQWDSLFYACWHALGDGYVDDPNEKAKYYFLAAISIFNAESTYLTLGPNSDVAKHYYNQAVSEMAKASVTNELQKLRDEAAGLLQIGKDAAGQPENQEEEATATETE